MLDPTIPMIPMIHTNIYAGAAIEDAFAINAST
jgi:hypothetical protein